MSDKRRKATLEKKGGVTAPTVRPSEATQPQASGGGPSTSNGSKPSHDSAPGSDAPRGSGTRRDR